MKKKSVSRPIGGTYTIVIGGRTSAPLPYDATPAAGTRELRRLMKLAGFGRASVARARGRR